MKKLRNSGNFFAALLFNMLMSLEWTIPAWLLLACHFFFDWSIRWFWIALGVWLLDILLKMEFVSWAAGCGIRTHVGCPKRFSSFLGSIPKCL